MGLWARYGADTMVRQIEDNRTQGAHGTAVYCYSNLFDNHKPNATARALKEKLFGAPARITGRLYND
ncbi:MAG: hypothetical protein BWZ10_00368 [candidate division BRC1 bacterium ADurb.BinA364]|nr:MAG: hypothetical protein BWZ10_00368 [candidate division BRC1 bacterium ADurb.BinA364]